MSRARVSLGVLLARARAGEREAVAELYARYFERIRGRLRRALDRPAEADDVAHQVFIKLIAGLAQLEGGAAGFDAWLGQIIKNFAVDHNRREARAVPKEPAAVDQLREGPDDGAGAALLETVSSAGFEQLIKPLPPLQRHVLVLRYQLDFSNEHIAKCLRRSPQSISDAHAQGLRALELKLRRVEAAGRWSRRVFELRRLRPVRAGHRFERLRPLAPFTR